MRPDVVYMVAFLTFECSVEGTPYRFVVRPRPVVPAANEDEP
jgi:hypothetical protein